MLLYGAALVSGCGRAEPPPPRMVRVPDVVGLAADRGMQRVHAAGLCPEARWADTIGSPPYSIVARVTPVPGTQVPVGTVVAVDVAPARLGVDIYVFEDCQR